VSLVILFDAKADSPRIASHSSRVGCSLHRLVAANRFFVEAERGDALLGVKWVSFCAMTGGFRGLDRSKEAFITLDGAVDLFRQ